MTTGFVVRCPLFTTRPFPTRERAEKELRVIEERGCCQEEHEVVEEG